MAAKKVMVIGLDAAIAPNVYQYAREGHMPRVKHLLENGVCGINSYPPFPSITPPSWTTLATGASSATHGVPCFNVHIPGTGLDDMDQAFDSNLVQAEFIWEAAERVGRKAIVVNYPTSWPPRMKMGHQIAGAGLSPNEYRTRDVKQWEEGFKASVAYDQLWTTGIRVLGTDLDVEPAKGWKNTPKAAKLLEAKMPLEYRRAKDKVKDRTWYALIVDSEGTGFDRVLVCASKDAAAPLAEMRLGQWSDTVVQDFDTAIGAMPAACKLKLLELSPSGEDVTIYRTPLAALKGWGFPAGVEAEIPLKGLPIPYPGYLAYRMGWLDLPTLEEMMELHHEWLAEAAHYLVANKEWDVYYMHVHTPDWVYHTYINSADRATAESEATWQRFHAAEINMYRSLDRLIARIQSAADENETVFLITSDHGAKPVGPNVNPGTILLQAGLVAFKPEKQKPEEEEEEFSGQFKWEKQETHATGTLAAKFEHLGEIDWSKTRAVPNRSCFIYVNLKGRDPQGIVDPKDYEKVQEEIIAALYNYTDPKTGLKPIQFAIKVQDARFFDMGGDGCGDVIYAPHPHYQGPHGGLLGSARAGEMGDVRTIFLLSGPGVKRGETIERTIWLKDVVPTLCYLADLPYPAQCEGAIVFQALEDPDMKVHECETIKRRYEKMRKSLDRAPMC